MILKGFGFVAFFAGDLIYAAFSFSRSLVPMLTLVAAVLVLTEAQRLSDDVTAELATMSREITSKHFSDSKCVAVVTDCSQDIMQYIQPIDIPVLQVHLPFGIMKDTKVQPTGTKTSKQQSRFTGQQFSIQTFLLYWSI
jgi:aspartokinase-like uncharacterized kinase